MSLDISRHLVVCNCHDCEHQVVFWHFAEDEDDFMYVSIHLVTWKNIFRRIWEAIRYILGHKSRYGNFDEIILDPVEAMKLVTYINRWLGKTQKPPWTGGTANTAINKDTKIIYSTTEIKP